MEKLTRPLVAWLPAAADEADLSEVDRETAELWRVDVPDGVEPSEMLLLKSWSGHGGGATVLGWAPGGKKLATGSTDGAVIIWSSLLSQLASITNLVPTADGSGRAAHQASVDALCWLSDKSVLVGGSDIPPQLWDVSGSTPRHVFDLRDGATGQRLEGCTAASACPGRYTDREVLQFYYPDAAGSVDGVDASEQILLAVAGRNADSAVVRVYAFSEAAGVATTVAVLDDGRPEPILDAQFAPGGLYIALAAGLTVAIWDVSPLHQPDPELGLWCCGRHTQHSGDVRGVSWAPPAENSAPMLASASLDCTVRIWRVATPPACPPNSLIPISEAAAAEGQVAGALGLDEALLARHRPGVAVKPAAVAVLRAVGPCVIGGVLDDDAGAAVRRQLNALQQLARALRHVEKAPQETALRGLEISRHPADLWRCYLPVAQRIKGWKAARDEAAGVRTPLLVGVGGAAGCGRSTFVQIMMVALGGLGLSSSDVSLADLVCDQYNWWTPGVTNIHLASTLALEPTTVVETLVRMLQSCQTDVVLVEDWRVGCEVADCKPLNDLLLTDGRCVCVCVCVCVGVCVCVAVCSPTTI